MKDTLKNWRNCGWSAIQQQHSKHETKRTAVLKTSKPVEFSRKIMKNEELFAVKWPKLWLEWNSTTTQIARIRNAINNNRDEKYEDRLEMSVHNGHDTGVMNWYNAGLRVISKTSGLSIVGDSKTIHVSKSRPFWNKCFILQYGMVYITHSKDDLGRRHIY